MVVDDGYTIEQTMENYNLSRAQVLSAMAFYYENQQVLDEARRQALAEIKANAMTLDKFKVKLAQKKQKVTE